MADTLVKNPKLIVGTQSQVEAEMGDNDIGFATDIKFYTAKEVDDLLSDLGGGASLPILTMMMSDHVINDMSWLRADTFSWQSGDVYVAAYEHLVADTENPVKHSVQLYGWEGDYYTTSKTPAVGDIAYLRDYFNQYGGGFYAAGTVWAYTAGNPDKIIVNLYSGIAGVGGNRVESVDTTGEIAERTDTIGDIKIIYYLAEDGHKICMQNQESELAQLHATTGAADYYVLDTTNKQFKLPRKQKRKLIRSGRDGDTYYNLYSDGWVEQYGKAYLDAQANVDISWHGQLLIRMANSSYVALSDIKSGWVNETVGGIETHEADHIQGFLRTTHTQSVVVSWSVSGFAAESAYASAGMNLEYYYVGNFEQSAVEQTAGLNTELFNGKADVDLRNTNFNELTFKAGNFNTRLVQQGDGNFVIYKDGTPIISTHSGGIALPANSIPRGDGEALACHSINLSENGYIRLTNGLIIQWGRHYGKGAQSYTVTLPTAFSNATFSIVYTQGAANMGDGIYANTNLAYPSSTTTFNVYRVYSEECTANWIAIGY